MKHKVAVEPNLTQVKDLLTSRGFQVESANIGNDASKFQNNYDAIIVTGLNTNTLGINDTSTKAVIINADGLTADEIFNQLQSRLK